MKESEIFRFRRNIVLAASAGTGKTFHLVGMIVHALLGYAELGSNTLRSPVLPEQIIATTFSRRAASEIQARIVQTLGLIERGEVEDRSVAPFLRSMKRLSEEHRETWDLTQVQERARKALESIQKLSVGTIHSLALSVVREFGLRVNLPPQLDLLDEEDAHDLATGEASRGFLEFARNQPEIAKRLVYSAGSFGDLLSNIVRCLEVTSELETPIEAFRPDSGSAQFAEWERQWQEALDSSLFRTKDHYKKVVRSLGTDRIEAIGELFATVSTKELSEAFPGFELKYTRKVDGERFAVMLEGWRLLDADIPKLLALVSIVRQRVSLAQLRLGKVDFSTLLRTAHGILRDHPAVGKEIRERTELLLVDEAQDTSPLQREFIEYLWERAPTARQAGDRPGEIRRAGLCIVGDRKQSIYGFRGADVRGFSEWCVALAGEKAREGLSLDTRELSKSGHADFFALKTNYRSHADILTWVNGFMAAYFEERQSPFDLQYNAETEDLLPPAETRPHVPLKGARVVWVRPKIGFRVSSAIENASSAASEIVALLEDPEAGLEPKDIAVLAYRNTALVAVEHALSARKVPYVTAGYGFWNTLEVRDLVSFLRLLVDPDDRLALLEVLRGPFACVLDQTLLELVGPRGLGDLEMLTRSPAFRNLDPSEKSPIEKLHAEVSQLREASIRGRPQEVLTYAVRAFELEETLIQLPRGTQRVANVRKLLSYAGRFRSCSEFLRRAKKAMDGESREGVASLFSDADNAVRLLTVHASKGLDFKVVFLVGFGNSDQRTERKLIELTNDRELGLTMRGSKGARIDSMAYSRGQREAKERDLAEFKRLTYVGLTRARDCLYLVGDRKPPKKTSSSFQLSAFGALQRLEERGLVTTSKAGLSTADIYCPRVAAAPPSGRPETVIQTPALTQSPAIDLSVTEWVDLSLCERKFVLRHELGLPIRDEGESSQVRLLGTLAHWFLQQASDPASAQAIAPSAKNLFPYATLDDLASAQNLAGRFWASPYAEEVKRRGGRLIHERPFSLRLDFAHVRGRMDLVVEFSSGDVDVIDFKLSIPRFLEPASRQLSLYRRSVETEPGKPGRTVRAGLFDLRQGEHPSWIALDERPTQDEPTTTSLPRRERPALTQISPNHLKTLPKRLELSFCKSTGCPYLGTCFGHQEAGGELGP